MTGTPTEAGVGEPDVGFHDHDIFVSHASEDKAAVARPLADALGARGWRVWLDELELTIGDSLSRRIDQALARSKFGVVVLSPAFFAKEWPQRELAGLVAREVNEAGAKVILPVWHEIDRPGIAERSPMLADRLGASTSVGIDNVADQISVALRHAQDRPGASDGPEPVVQAIVPAPPSQVLSVPTTPLEQKQLLADKPAGWEFLLFAGSLLQGRNELEPKWHDHELRMPRGERREIAGTQEVIAFLSREREWLMRQMTARLRVFEPAAQELTFGAPGEPGDAGRIQHCAGHVVATYEVFMDWAASLRNAVVPEVWSEVVDATATLVDSLVRQIRDFVDTVVTETLRMQEMFVNGRDDDQPIEVTIRLSLDIASEDVEAVQETTRRAVQRIQDGDD